MLKHIYKTFLIAILSCSLMTLNISHQGIHFSNVQAETLKTDGIKDEGLMATLTMTAVGFIAARLYKYKMTPDIMVAAAGGVAFLAGEVLAASQLKKVAKDLETEIKRDKNGKIEQAQIESLEKLKKSYQEAKKTANTKKMLQMAAAAAFAGAGVMAYFFTAQEDAAFLTCNTTVTAAVGGGLGTCITASQASCIGPQYAACAPPLVAICNSCATTISSFHAKRSEHKVTREVPIASLPGLTKDIAQVAIEKGSIAAITAACASPQAAPMGKAANGACQPWAAAYPVNNSAGSPVMDNFGSIENQFMKSILTKHGPTSIAHIIKNDKSLMEEIMNMIVPSANASLLSPMGIASSLAIAFVMATSTSLAMTVDTFLLTPRKRAMVWGVLAGLTFMASQATDQAIQKIDQNIQKIDQILNYMYNLNPATTTANVPTKPAVVTPVKPQNQGVNFDPDSYESTDVSGGSPNGGTPCFTKETNGKCEEFGADVLKSPAVLGMAPAIQMQLKDFAKMGEGFNRRGTFTNGAMSDAARMANGFNAMKSAYDKAKKNYDDNRKKFDIKGKKNIGDLNAFDLEGKMRAAVVKQLKAQNMSPSQMMAAFGSGSMYTPGGEKPDTSMASLDETPNANAMANVIDISAPETAASADFGGAAGEGDEASKASLMAIKGAGAKGTSIDDYDLKNDITKDKETSLFDLISNRYQKSGYPRLFKRVK